MIGEGKELEEDRKGKKNVRKKGRNERKKGRNERKKGKIERKKRRKDGRKEGRMRDVVNPRRQVRKVESSKKRHA